MTHNGLKDLAIVISSYPPLLRPYFRSLSLSPAGSGDGTRGHYG